MSSMQILLRESGAGIVLPTSAKHSGDSDVGGFADLLKRGSSTIESSQPTFLEKRVIEEPRVKKDVPQSLESFEVVEFTIGIDPTLVVPIGESVEFGETVNAFSSLNDKTDPASSSDSSFVLQINTSSNDEQLATALNSGIITDQLITTEGADERDMSTNGEDASRSDKPEDKVVVAVPVPIAFMQVPLDTSTSSIDIESVNINGVASQQIAVVVQQTQMPQNDVGEANLIQASVSMIEIEEVGAAIIRNDRQNIVIGSSSVSLDKETSDVNLERHDDKAPMTMLSTPQNMVLSTKQAELPTSNIAKGQDNVQLVQPTGIDLEYTQEIIIGSSNVVKAFAGEKVSKPIIVETADAAIVDNVLPVPRVVELANDYQTAPKSLPIAAVAKGLDDFTEYSFEIVQDTIVDTGEVNVNRAEITFTKVEEEVTAKTLSDVGVDHKMHKATIDQVMIAVKQMRNSNSKSVIINLHPAELGKIEIKLHVHDNAVQKIEMTAANRDTIALLQDSMAKLEAELKKVIGSEGASLHFNFKEGNHQESRGGERTQASLSKSYNNPTLGEVVSNYHISSRHHIGESGVSIRV